MKLLPPKGSLVALDTETLGIDAVADDFEVVGIGLSWSEGSIYLNRTMMSLDNAELLHEYLLTYKLVAHNVTFDASAMKRVLDDDLNWVCCTYALYKQIATEGYPAQRWGLKSAQIDLLGWPETNEAELDEWLIASGYTKGNTGRPDKSKMGLAPANILGKYCAEDADACYQLYQLMHDQALTNREWGAELWAYHTVTMTLINLIVEQYMRGMLADEQGLVTYSHELEREIEHLKKAFLNHKDINHHVGQHNQTMIDEIEDKEPPKLTKTGKDSKRWQAWNERVAKARATQWFNINSKDHLSWLMFDCLGYKPVKTTTTGKPSVDKKSLPQFGQHGAMLVRYNKYTKELGYVKGAIVKTTNDTAYPQYRVPGALTGRLSGTGGFNWQQQPKTRAYLKNFKARPGHKIVQLDFTALEPTVLAAASRDASLWQLYGPGVPANDVYLFTAAHIPALGKNILEYYDPLNPTKQGIADAKKYCKRDRNVAKTVVLAANYNAGAQKIHETLTLGGIDISLREVYNIRDAYWELYEGVKDFESLLKNEWKQRGGYILNGVGRPIAVGEDLLKDINNRYCQSTGHDLLMYYLSDIEKLRRDRSVTMYPWIVDYHDETMWEVPDDEVEQAKLVLEDALVMLNKHRLTEIAFKGDVMICDNLAEIKCED